MTALATLMFALGRAAVGVLRAASRLPMGFFPGAALGSAVALAAFLGVDAFWSFVAASSYPTSDYIVESQELVRRLTAVAAAAVGFVAGFSLTQRR